MGFVTANCPLMLLQIAETRLVVDCRVNPVAFVGHVKTTLVPERMIISCGRLTDPSERLNTVPLPPLPPLCAVPYKVLLDKSKKGVSSLFVI